MDEAGDTVRLKAAAKSLQSCPNLCDPIDGSPLGSPVPGILKARTLEWVAISFGAGKWKVKVQSFSRVRLLATPWTAAYKAPPSMGFSRQNTWVGCHWRQESYIRNLLYIVTLVASMNLEPFGMNTFLCFSLLLIPNLTLQLDAISFDHWGIRNIMQVEAQ